MKLTKSELGQATNPHIIDLSGKTEEEIIEYCTKWYAELNAWKRRTTWKDIAAKLNADIALLYNSYTKIRSSNTSLKWGDK